MAEHWRVHPVDGGTRVELVGTVSIMDAGELRALALALQGEQRVTVDGSELDHLDSAAVQVLIALRAGLDSSGGRLEIESLPDSVRQYLRWAGLESQLLPFLP